MALTLRQASQQRLDKHAAFDAKWPVAPGAQHPAIGSLVREGRTVFYAFVDGVYREGSTEHLVGLLESAGAR